MTPLLACLFVAAAAAQDAAPDPTPATDFSLGTTPPELDLAGDQGLAGNRSTVSPLVADTLGLLSEIALEQASRRAQAYLSEQAARLVCEDLNTVQVHGGSVAPATCEVLRAHGLLTLANSPVLVSDALTADAVDLALRAVADEVPEEGQEVVRDLATIALQTIAADAMDGQTPDANDVSAALAVLAAAAWVTAPEGPGQCAAATVVQLAAAAEGHTAGDLLTLLRDGDLGACSEALSDPRVKTQLAILAADLYGLTQLKASGEELAARLVATLFDVAELALRVAESTDASTERARQVVELSEDLALAALERDALTLVGAAAGLALAGLERTEGDAAEDAREALERVAPVVAALASNAASLEAALVDPTSAEAEREARKAALEAVIESATRRDHRQGDTVWSLGANVGLVPVSLGMGADEEGSVDSFFAPSTWDAIVGAAEDGAEAVTEVPPALTMPLGLVWQKLPNHKDFGVGFHAQLSPFDLAEWLPNSTQPAEDLTWAEVVVVDLQLALALGRPQDLFTVGAFARYNPYAPDEDLWRAGVVLSYYVPFFDLN